MSGVSLVNKKVNSWSLKILSSSKVHKRTLEDFHVMLLEKKIKVRVHFP